LAIVALKDRQALKLFTAKRELGKSRAGEEYTVING
jgi:hypothetical protein